MSIEIELVSLGYAEKQNHSMQSNSQLATYHHRWPVHEEDVHSGPAKETIESIILQLCVCVCIEFWSCELG